MAEKPDELDQLMEPSEALKLIKRLRAVGPCTINLMVDKRMPTTDDMYFPGMAVLPDVTLKQAEYFLGRLQETHDTRVQAGKDKPRIRVRVSENYLDERKKTVWL